MMSKRRPEVSMVRHPDLGLMPAHWRPYRLRHLVKLNPSRLEGGRAPRGTAVSFLPMEAIGDDGSLELDRTRLIQEVETGFSYFRDGDVAIAKITPCFENGKGAVMSGLLNGIGFGTTELIVARPGPEVLPEFLHFVFRSTPFLKRGENEMYGAGGQKRLPDDFVRNFRLALPPLREQRSIVGFLRAQIVAIDALIAEQAQLIELLNEKRQALAADALTRGLNPTAPMKDSGVDWMGRVPAHWRVVRNKNVLREVDERDESGDGELMTVSHITGVTPRKSKQVNMILAETLQGYKRGGKGDLVINTMWAWMGALGISPCDGLFSPSYNVYRILDKTQLLPEYYELLCRLPGHVTAMKARSTGIWESRLRLYPDVFLGMAICFPDSDEQRRIVSAVAARIKEFGDLIEAAETNGDLLSERRSALITAAVTGQLSVPEIEDRSPNNQQEAEVA